MTRLGNFEYNGNGQTLEQNTEYAVFETENGIEAYPEGDSEPVTMKKATFVSLRSGNLERVEGGTPMR